MERASRAGAHGIPAVLEGERDPVAPSSEIQSFRTSIRKPVLLDHAISGASLPEGGGPGETAAFVPLNAAAATCVFSVVNRFFFPLEPSAHSFARLCASAVWSVFRLGFLFSLASHLLLARPNRQSPSSPSPAPVHRLRTDSRIPLPEMAAPTLQYAGESSRGPSLAVQIAVPASPVVGDQLLIKFAPSLSTRLIARRLPPGLVYAYAVRAQKQLGIVSGPPNWTPLATFQT